jgi:hypothetical protein
MVVVASGVVAACAAAPGSDAVPVVPVAATAAPGSSASALDADTSSESGGRALSAVERAGRDTWRFWTGGNEKFWRQMAIVTGGNVDLLMYLDSFLKTF